MAATSPSVGDGDTDTDPTLAALVPARSRLRDAVLILTAVLVLAAAWMSPHVVRLGLTSDGGTGAAFAATHQVLTSSHAVVRGWPRATVHAVRSGTEGARVLDAWLVRGHEDIGWDIEAEFTDGYEALRSTDLADRLDGIRLPATAAQGDEVQLLVLWEVTECAALTEPEAWRDPSTAAAQLEMSTPLGLARTTGLEGYDPLDAMWIEDAGACP